MRLGFTRGAKAKSRVGRTLHDYFILYLSTFYAEFRYAGYPTQTQTTKVG